MANYYRRKSFGNSTQAMAPGAFSALPPLASLGKNMGNMFEETGKQNVKVALELRKQKNEMKKEEMRLKQQREEKRSDRGLRRELARGREKIPQPSKEEKAIMQTGGKVLVDQGVLPENAATALAEKMANSYNWEPVDVPGNSGGFLGWGASKGMKLFAPPKQKASISFDDTSDQEQE